MADVFISYSREDRARADQIAAALQRDGMQVFWDSEIPPGQTWADYVEEKLTQCKAVLVLWSQHSTKSQWVREEARIGRDKGKLIPIMIDGTPAPFGFGEVQAADLSRWNGDEADPSWKRIADAVRGALSREPKPQAQTPHPGATQYQQPHRAAPAPQPAQGGKKGVHPVWWAVGGGAAVLVALIMLGSIANQPDPPNNPATTMQNFTQPAQNPQSGTQLTEADYQQQMMTNLVSIQQSLSAQGFQQIGQPTTGSLNTGATIDVPATLYVGNEYRVAAVCDNDCSDIDLTLFDGSGNIISQDSEVDPHPVVPVVVTGSGQFTVRVNMYACNTQPCFYAVTLFGRQTQQ